jgi:hypothetical protein
MISVGCNDVQGIAIDPHDRHVERAAAEIEYENRLGFVQLIESVGQCSRRRFVDNLQDIESGKLAGSNRGRALGVIEIRRDRDDRIRDRLLQIFLGVAFELHQDHC